MRQDQALPGRASPFSEVRRHVTPVTLAAGLFAAFAYSLQSIAGFALSDSPLGFVALVPVLALILFLYDGREARAPAGAKRDYFVDFAVALPPLLVALYIMLILPPQQSIYFWLHRLDLLALPLTAVAIVSIVWGAHAVFRMWRTLGYLFLLWPYPLIEFQARFGGFFTDLSSVTARSFVRTFDLPFALDPNDIRALTYTGGGQNAALYIDQVCSGLTAFLGFLVAGIPIVLLLRGSLTMRAVWLVTGASLALLSNLMRVGLLLAAIDTFGFDTALDYVHPMLGFALFFVVLVVMLAALPLFGLRLPLPPTSKTHRWLWETPGRETLPRKTALLLAVVVGVFFALNQNLRYFQWDVATAETAPVRVAQVADLMPQEMGGRTLIYNERASWPQLFGRSSLGAIFIYRGQQDDPVGAQVVLAKDRDGFRRYSVENCTLFHGDQVIGVRQVFLGHGVTARVVNERTEGVDGSRIYWMQPVEMNGERYHARIMLYADQTPSMRPLGRAEVAAKASDPPIYGFVRSFLDAVDGEPAPPRERFAAVDSHLIAMAEELVARLFAGDTAVVTTSPVRRTTSGSLKAW